MVLKDKNKDVIEGVFTIERIDKQGNIIDTYTEKNLIMDTARSSMAEMIGGLTPYQPINKLKLGNKGHNGTDVLDYKKVGENNEFITSRTMMFSEDPNYDDANDTESFVYEITFNVEGVDRTTEDSNAKGKIITSDDSEEETCKVTRSVNTRSVTYIIEIPEDAGNKPGEGEVMPYTEASLWAGDKIFSMKSFACRVKEDTVSLRIKWQILF